MEQLDDSDGNRHIRNTNIKHFAPYLESTNEKGTTPNMKSNNTSVIVLSEDEDEKKNKVEQNEYNEENEYDQERDKMAKTNNPNGDDELNGDCGSP